MTKQQQQLVEDNMNLVYFTIARYYPHHKGDDDVVQIGMMGLCKAAASYDDSKGQFSTYAIIKIRSAISYEFRKDSKRVKAISLDAERDAQCGDKVALQEFIIGDMDEGYVDVAPLCNVLTPRQRAVFELLRQGFSCVDIAKRLGVSKQSVHQRLRVIQKKWEATMGK